MRLLLIWTILLLTLSSVAQNVTDSQGRKQGSWKKNYPNSKQIRYEGQFKDDQPIGEFSYYGTDGKIVTKVKHTGSGVSYSTSFNPLGKIVSSGKYINQKKDSVWTFYNEEGKLLSEETYLNDMLHGYNKVFYANGQASLIQQFRNNKLNGTVTTYLENGTKRTENTFLNDTINGPSTTYFPNGKVNSEGQYSKGVKTGTWKEYNEDGSLRTVSEYRNDVAVETVKVNGVFLEYFGNELPKASYTYKDKVLDGPFVEYQEGGSWELVDKVDPLSQETNKYRVPKNHFIKQKGTYLNGKLHGKLEIFDKFGNVSKTVIYANGILK